MNGGRWGIVKTRSEANVRRRSGFTLIELLVVVGIIIVATAMAMPAINQFLKGQKLVQAGRLVQSAFNEARRSAITQRADHYIFFGRIGGQAGQPDMFALAHYRAGKGWDSVQLTRLPSTIQPIFGAAAGEEDDFTKPMRGCNLFVQDWTNGLPPADSATAVLDVNNPGKTCDFMDPASLRVVKTCRVYQFRKDGTIAALNGAVDVPALTNPDIFDVNTTLDVINPNQPADMILKQIGEPSKRCFVDVDVNTGRVRFRVAETQAQDGTGNDSTH